MPDGEMRRPPQLWEQKLLKLIGVGSSGLSLGGATSSSSGTGGGGGGGGIPTPEPGPELPPPGAFIKPSTPQLTGSVQGIRVRWDGLNSAGDLWPYDTSWIEVHMATSGTGFTPDSTTLKGRLDYPGEFFVGGLAAGTTYHFRLRGADAAGNVTEPSDAASGQTGLTTSSDYGTATITQGAVSFNARQIGGVTSTVGTVTPTSPVVGDIWLDTTGGATTHKRWNGTTWEVILFGSGSIANNAITEVKIDTNAVSAAKIAASAVTETKIASNAVTSPKIVAGAIEAGKIAAGAVTAEKIAASAVEADKIAANAVTAGKIAANTITGDKIAANTITGSLIAANTISATNIGAGAITAGAIAAGAVTAEKITADAIDGKTIVGATIKTAGTVGTSGYPGVILNTAGLIGYDSLGNERFNFNASNGNATITGNFRTGTSGARVEMGDAFGVLSTVNVYGASGLVGASGVSLVGNYRVAALAGYKLELDGDLVDIDAPATVAGTLTCNGALDANGNSTFGDSGGQAAFRVQNDDVYSYGINDNTTANAANVRCGAFAQLLLSTSTVRVKDELSPLDDDLAGVPEEKLSGELPSVDPYDVLTITPTEFRSTSPADDNARLLGFIAEDVAAKFPWAADWDDEGIPSTVEDRPILAALLAVVKDQQATITDLRSRIEALEAP